MCFDLEDVVPSGGRPEVKIVAWLFKRSPVI
jgi:hypothetical protein